MKGALYIKCIIRSVTITCVPVVGAAGPGELIAEGKDQVEQGPGQYDGVGYAAVQQNHLARITYTWRTKWSISVKESFQNPNTNPNPK